MATDMVTEVFRPRGLRPIHPLHAILLGFPFALFLAGLTADIAYASTYQIQWSNFAAWLNAGGLLVGAFVGLWAIVEAVRFRAERPVRAWTYLAVLLVMWIVGFLNALVHARDAWAVMPAGLWLSVVAALLALVAAWIGYSGLRRGEVI